MESKAANWQREFFDRICRDEKINKESATVLHSDNGVQGAHLH